MRNPQKRAGMIHNLQHLFQRGEITQQEVRTLHGVIASLSVGRRVRGRLDEDWSVMTE